MMEFAQLLVKTEQNPFTYRYDVASVEWVGHHSLMLEVNKEIDAEVLKFLPFELEECQSPYNDLFPFPQFRYYIRKDRHYWLAYHRFMSDWAQVLRAWQWIKCRIIMTLVVWGIGWVEYGQMVDWYCLGQKKPWSLR